MWLYDLGMAYPMITLLPPEALASIARLHAIAPKISAIVDVAEITDELAPRVALVLRGAETLVRDAEVARRAAKAPYLAAGAEVDEAFRAPRSELERVAGLLRGALSRAAESRERERVAALAAARDAAAEGDHVAANAAIASIPSPATTLSGVAEVWSYEPVSIDLVALDPRYRAVDMVAVRAEIRAAVSAGREPVVAGIVFERRASVRVSRL